MKRRMQWSIADLLVLMPFALIASEVPEHGRLKSAPFVIPPFECEAYVGHDRDQRLPGYLLPTKAGEKTCIPFTSAREHPPENYEGDFYVDEFTDAKLRGRWEDCKENKECRDRIYAQLLKRRPPNREYNLNDPHKRFMLGKIEEKGSDTDLSTIRRPGFFARAPYNEPIAAVDPQTYIVEFTAPPDPYERLHMHMTDNVKIRGWYIRGSGIDDGSGGNVRSLIIMNGGGGDRITAIDNPSDVHYTVDPKTGKTVFRDVYPNETTGVQGQRHWREVWNRLHQAGFDVLAMDRRGIGISGGYSDTNTLLQGRDILGIIAALRSGEGVRALSPTGVEARGHDAAAMVFGGKPDKGLPVFLLGNSRGSMSSGWAMTINYDKDCSYDMPEIRCRPPVGDNTLKGAMLVAEYSSGVGYLPSQTAPKNDARGAGRDRGLFIGGLEVEQNIVFFPSSAILAGMDKWPSAFFARGLWCYAAGLEGTADSYRRVKGLKELVVVRGPHPFVTWPEEEKSRTAERMIAYASAVVLGKTSIPGRGKWSNMKELVATASDVWETSTHPTVVH